MGAGAAGGGPGSGDGGVTCLGVIGECVVVGDASGRVAMLEPAEQQAGSPRGPPLPTPAAAPAPRGTGASSSSDGGGRGARGGTGWALEAGSLVAEEGAHAGAVAAVVATDWLERCVSCGADGMVKVSLGSGVSGLSLPVLT